jgi:hypothetical protein
MANRHGTKSIVVERKISGSGSIANYPAHGRGACTFHPGIQSIGIINANSSGGSRKLACNASTAAGKMEYRSGGVYVFN